jgi:hypothetical protein
VEAVVKLAAALIAMSAAFSASPTSAGDLSVDLQPSSGNTASPQMGDNLSFHTVIRNDGNTPVDGLIAWISLVQIDRGKEQPVDLEDWSAQKAVSVVSLAPGRSLETDWPMRLIQAGRYRVVVSAVSRNSAGLTASPFADFTVRQKSVLESQRVLPVAFGVPMLIGCAILWRRFRNRHGRASVSDRSAPTIARRI